MTTYNTTARSDGLFLVRSDGMELFRLIPLGPPGLCADALDDITERMSIDLEEYTEAECKAAFEEGEAVGQEKGHDEGFDVGREAGLAEGYDEGYTAGHAEGYKEGAYNAAYGSP